MKKTILAGAIALMAITPAAFAQNAMTSDTAPTGSIGSGTDYTIVSRRADASNAANTNTDPMAVQRTIEANPGLAEKLASQNVPLASIDSITVKPNREVTIYVK